MTVVVRVRFRPRGNLYDYDAAAWPTLQRGDFVVVQTRFGPQVGEVVQVREQPPAGEQDAPADLEPVLRRATAHDLALRQLRQNKEVELLVNLRAKVRDLGRQERRYQRLRIVEVELSLDDRHMRVLYTDEDEDSPLGGAVRRLGQRLAGPRQVHWVRLGPRDAAKLSGGVGACGMPERCCSLFMHAFQSVSVRMAKVQNVSLGPHEITGMCGRLRCCLRFEFATYQEARATLPKERKRVRTPEGVGRVIAVHPLSQQVTVEIPDKGRLLFAGAEVQPVQPPCDGCPHQRTAG